MSDYTENMNRTNAARPKNARSFAPDIDFYRKNGVPRVRVTNRTQDNKSAKSDASKKKGHHIPPTAGGYGYQAWQVNKPNAGVPAGVKKAAERYATGVRTDTLDKRRAERTATGSYKGKYLGPDEFKGDMSVLKAWRKSGSNPSDKAKFAAKAKGTGWHGTKGKGQGGEKDWGRRKIDYATDNMGRKTVVQYEKRKTS